MKKVLFGFLWFVVFLAAGLMILGVLSAPDTSGYEGAIQSYEAGYAVGHEKGQRYGKFIMLASLALSVAGTVLGWLPGTRSRRKA